MLKINERVNNFKRGIFSPKKLSSPKLIKQMFYFKQVSAYYATKGNKRVNYSLEE